LASEELANAHSRPAAAPDTLSALIASYRRSASYLLLRATTKQGYASRLAKIDNAHGQWRVSRLKRANIEAILAPLADRPGTALSILKMLRILIRHSLALGWLNADPSVGIRRPRSGEVRSWTDQEIAQFEARWPLGSRERLAFALHLYTGQRRSDVHRMAWSDIAQGRLRLVQQKTGKSVQVKIHPELQRALETSSHTAETILITAYGRPFTVDGFSGFMRDAIKAAGLPMECQPHGLRKAAGRRLAEAGCSAKQIMAVLGHKSLAEAERYVRDADEVRLGDEAISKQVEYELRTRAASTRQ
jgi:integrase